MTGSGNFHVLLVEDSPTDRLIAVQALKLGPYLTFELIQEGERLALVERQLAALKAERERMVASSQSKIAHYTRRLRELGAVAQESSFVFSAEVFGWRTFANRRERDSPCESTAPYARSLVGLSW